MSIRSQNLASVAVVARGLKDLLPGVAFVGGATIALYVDDPSASDARFTKDVDCIVELAGHAAFAKLEMRLRKFGFVHATEEGAPICRWHFQGVTVDVMPTDGTILGFSNRWYREAMKHLRRVEIEPKLVVNLLSLPYLLATKLEAFAERGKGDWLASHDLEDVIAVLAGATPVEKELLETRGALRGYLQRELGRLASHPDIDEILSAHLPPDPGSRKRRDPIKQLLARVVRVQSES